MTISTSMRRWISMLVVAAALLVPDSALAGASSTCQAYNPQQICAVPNVTTGTGSISSVPPSNVESGTLPFTGLDLVLVLIVAVALLGAGFVARSVSRRLD